MTASRHTRYQAVVLRDDNTMLLVRCIFSDGRDWWMLPGGGREDETEEACIVREVHEETGLDVRVERLLADLPADPPDGTYVRWRTYLCRITGGNAAAGGGEGPNATLVDVQWIALFDECAWPGEIRRDPFLSPQLSAFRASLMPRVRAVLFDLDDTLLDRRATVDHYLAQFTKRRGFSPDVAASYLERFHSLDGAGYTPRRIVFDALGAEFAGAGDADELIADWEANAWNRCVYVAGAVELLQWCRSAGLRTAIVTNGRARFQRPKIDRLGVAEHVDVTVVSGEEGMHKPDPELFRRAAERLAVAPNECLFVGDNAQNDVAGAIAAGMHAVWFERYLPWPEEIARPTHSIAELRSLQRILEVAGGRADPSLRS
jgi:putative hydrolase of the HAD superfamily